MLPIFQAILQGFLSNALTSGAKGEGQPGGNMQSKPMINEQNNNDPMKRLPTLGFGEQYQTPTSANWMQKLPRY